MKRKPRRRAPEDERERYAIAVASWDYHYGFRVADGGRFDAGPYAELATLTFRGDVIRPAPCRYPRGEVTLSLREDEAPAGVGGPAVLIGSVDARDGCLQAYVFVPGGALTRLIPVAVAGLFRAVALDTTRVFRRRALVRGVRLYTDPDEEDL